MGWDAMRSALQRTSKGGRTHVWRVADVDNTVKGGAVANREGGVISYYYSKVRYRARA